MQRSSFAKTGKGEIWRSCWRLGSFFSCSAVLGGHPGWIRGKASTCIVCNNLGRQRGRQKGLIRVIFHSVGSWHSSGFGFLKLENDMGQRRKTQSSRGASPGPDSSAM